MLNFDEAFKGFLPKTSSDIRARRLNEACLTELGIDTKSDDTVFGASYVYCDPHRTVHATGWCTVGIASKRPLDAANEKDALHEAALLGLIH